MVEVHSVFTYYNYLHLYLSGSMVACKNNLGLVFEKETIQTNSSHNSLLSSKIIKIIHTQIWHCLQSGC